MDINESPFERFENYNGNKCWQGHLRDLNYQSDLIETGFTEEIVNTIKAKDIEFSHISKEDKETCQEIKDFIVKHEWLGKMPNRPTHRFIAKYNNILMGVLVMATPNAFSNLMGRENRDLEKLISRGASMSLAPKNMGSRLIMYSINWMVKNTSFRFFTCYSDPQAKELGTIYQACNFIYLGQEYGARDMFYDPERPNKPLFTDREFRKVSYFKVYAQDLGIQWQSNWAINGKMQWQNMSTEIQERLRQASRDRKHQCESISLPPKHKYVYIKGVDKRQTKLLKNIFKAHNPTLTHKLNGIEKLGLEYPSPHQRGLVINS